jgi:hypothetical protein
MEKKNNFSDNKCILFQFSVVEVSSGQDISHRCMTIVHLYGSSPTLQRIFDWHQGIGFPKGGEKLWDSPLIIPNNSSIRVVFSQPQSRNPLLWWESHYIQQSLDFQV